jgi:hypothetical protein
MPTQHQRIQQRLKAFDFAGLFTQELMWNHFPTRPLEIPVDGTTYTLTPVAQRGMAVFECVPPTDGQFPKYAVRRKIDTQVSKAAREHIIIFHDHAKTVQVWQWVKRESGKHSACREQFFYTGQSGDALVQKIQSIAFSLDDEANITETVVRVGAAFDVDKVTKKFYELFKKEHDTFLKFVEGIPDAELERWYVSVMLNRLMFIYFIQKKGFLSGDPHYLRSKLAETKKKGKDKYYRGFLCPLFFEGFAKRPEQRGAEANKMLGQVPYLNGGLFLKHQIEELHGTTANIPDRAFDRVFDFFEQYDWHLDDRPTRTGREINPDVLGYVFEKYINQKEMGAYYSKEDITEYISKNTIIPALFDMARKSCKIAFEGEHSVWRLLQSEPDRYAYAPMLRGMGRELPKSIAAGINDVSQRDDWNKPAESEFSLPTETWREVAVRRTRCEELRRQLASGEVRSIEDLVTYNLDISRFAEEVIANCEGPDLLRAFYKAIRSFSVLDPACGSGAFLFAALNILERLYDSCLVRMQAFVDDLDRSEEKHSPEKFKDFRLTLEEMNDKARHPSPRYFILKSIVLNNLYGVDIMEEATEICKLRLFLKLVAQVNPGDKIEPLPDIDFNIRAGNALVGFATDSQLDKSLSRLGHHEKKKDIDQRAADAGKAFERFRQAQVVGGTGSPEDLAKWKAEVQKRISALRDELDDYLAGDYNVKTKDTAAFRLWRSQYQPFHWSIEFFGIMNAGKFDVVIGNPPYVEYTKKNKETKKSVRDRYQITGYRTEDCDDLYAFFLERCQELTSTTGAFGMIVPVSIVSTDGFKTLRKIMLEPQATTWILNFAERPSKLFSGVEKRLTIWIAKHEKKDKRIFVSRYRRWFSEERNLVRKDRDALFSRIEFTDFDEGDRLVADSIPKISSNLERSILRKLATRTTVGTRLARTGQDVIFYTRKLRYFVQFFDFIPEIHDAKGKLVDPSELKEVVPRNEKDKTALLCCLNSSLFFWFFTVFSDVRNINRREIEWFRFGLDEVSSEFTGALAKLSKRLMEDFNHHSRLLTNNYKKYGKLTIQSFQPRLSKPVIDDIDRAIAAHYELTPEELDFIISFDYKYRMGQDDEEDFGDEGVDAATAD